MKKSKKRRRTPPVNLAVAWYKPEQWSRLLEISADSDELETTHAEWLSLAEKALKNLTTQGLGVAKIEVDVEDLLSWCRERDLPINGENRSRYAAWLLEERAK